MSLALLLTLAVLGASFFVLLSAPKVSAAANFYLVAGDAACTATNLGTDADCWSAASGGAGGAGIPGATDTIVIDANSNAGGVCNGFLLACKVDVALTVAAINADSTALGGGFHINFLQDVTVTGNVVLACANYLFEGRGAVTGGIDMTFTVEGAVANFGQAAVPLNDRDCLGAPAIVKLTSPAGVLTAGVTNSNACAVGRYIIALGADITINGVLCFKKSMQLDGVIRGGAVWRAPSLPADSVNPFTIGAGGDTSAPLPSSELIFYGNGPFSLSLPPSGFNPLTLEGCDLACIGGAGSITISPTANVVLPALNIMTLDATNLWDCGNILFDATGFSIRISGTLTVGTGPASACLPAQSFSGNILADSVCAAVYTENTPSTSTPEPTTPCPAATPPDTGGRLPSPPSNVNAAMVPIQMAALSVSVISGLVLFLANIVLRTGLGRYNKWFLIAALGGAFVYAAATYMAF